MKKYGLNDIKKHHKERMTRDIKPSKPTKVVKGPVKGKKKIDLSKLPMERKIKMREQMITDLLQFRNCYDELWVKSLVDKYCYNSYIPISSGITEDIISECVYNLLKMNIDKLLSSYYNVETGEQTFKKVLALFKKIIIRKGFAKHPSGNPKHSLSKYLMFTSSLQKSVSHEDVLYNQDSGYKLDDDVELTPMDKVREHLTLDEKHLLDIYLELKFTAQNRRINKKLDKIPKIHYQQLEQRIKEIVEKNNITL